jgi:hypothetical protein
MSDLHIEFGDLSVPEVGVHSAFRTAEPAQRCERRWRP